MESEVKTWHIFTEWTRLLGENERELLTISTAGVFARDFVNRTAVKIQKLDYRAGKNGTPGRLRVDIDYIQGGSTPEQWFWDNLPSAQAGA